MKTWLFIYILSQLVICSFGQVSVKGRILDDQQTLPSATVLLLNSDSVLVKGLVTGITGEFIFKNVEPGLYLVSASMVGYGKYFSLPIAIAKTDILLADILLEETSQQLNEVVITAQKSLFEQKSDRLIVNVQSSITSSGNTILEVLQKSPGIVVNKQSNSISMNGKAGVRLMINGRLMQLPLDVVVQMLDGMNSSNVEKIELITTPPSKYDAEGNAGIIHIVTKENIDTGTNGSFGGMLGYRWAEMGGGNFNLSHRTKKFAYTMDYSILRNHTQHISQIDRQSLSNMVVQTVSDFGSREVLTTQQNLNAGFEWKLDANTLLNVGLTSYSRNWKMDATNADKNKVTGDSTLNTNMKIHELNIWQSVTSTIGLQRRLNTKSDLSVNLDYLFYHNHNPSNYDNNRFYEQSNINQADKIDLRKQTPIQFYIAKGDYQYRFSSSLTFETGFKGVTSRLDNNVLVRRLINNQWETDPTFTSHATLDEQIVAGYVSTKWQFKNNWLINSGLRYENTHTAIGSQTQKNLINRKYGYFFPNLLLQKELNNERDIQFSYSRRISRPTYNDIAPYVFFWGPTTFGGGNTSLLPSISDAVKIGYHIKQWSLSLQYSHARREIVSTQPEQADQSGNVIYRAQNLKYLNTITVNNSYSFSPALWWEIQSYLTMQYQIARTSQVQHNDSFHLYGLNVSVTNLLKLPNDFAFEISGFYQSKSLNGINTTLPLGSLNAGIQKNLSEKGTLRISVDDMLYTNIWRIETSSQQSPLRSYWYYDYHNQSIRLTYSRSIGNKKLRSIKLKSGSEEERKRVAN
jgi:hypothetical protein